MAIVLPHSLKAFVNTTFLLLLCFFFKTHIRSPSPSFNLINANINLKVKTPKGSDGSSCISLYVIYYPLLGYTLLAHWLIISLYLLANTASQYLCPSLESLTRELRLPPPISGVTVLLSLGNGSPHVFAAFTSMYLVHVLIVAVVHIRRNDHKYEDLAVTKEARPKGNEEHDPYPSCYVKFKAMASHYVDMASYLPKRLTMPNVSEDRWPSAAASAALAPLLIAALRNTTKRGRMMGITASEGLTKKGVLPWLAVGFLMSVLWTCIRAEELAGLGVSLGRVLGLTVVAWGNSLGDLAANVAMALRGAWGGQDEAQIALISGNYAVPILNTMAGLGSSLVMSAWSAHPMPFVIPVGPEVFEILGFVIGGLLWALVILPKRDMKLDSVLGMGLLAIYSCFLSLRLSQSLGLVQL